MDLNSFSLFHVHKQQRYIALKEVVIVFLALWQRRGKMEDLRV